MGWYRQRAHAGAEQSSLPLTRPLYWRLALGLIFVSLLAALWYIGHGAPAWHAFKDLSWITAIWDSIAYIFGGIARVVTPTVGAPQSQRLACLALLLLLFWAFRRQMIARNAYKPGPVEVCDLEDATAGSEDKQLVKDLTAQFRKHLSQTSLYPPSELPAETPPESFLDLLGEVDPGHLGTSLMHVFSRLRPRVAYRVSGALRRRDADCPFGVTVTVTSFARGSTTTTIWQQDWERTVQMASYWVMAKILPVTRAGRQAPWRSWRGWDLPHTLFAAYQEGRSLSRDRKFDEALEQFYKALHLDPENVYLRNQIGATQEKMGLYLDALATYSAALRLGRLDADKENRYLWHRAALKPLGFLKTFFYVLSWRHQPGFIQTHYRYSIVLGTTEQTAKQWCKDDRDINPTRKQVREGIRKSLAGPFSERYWPALMHPQLRSKANESEKEHAKKYLKRCLCGENESDNVAWEKQVKLIFQISCVQEMVRLNQNYRFAALIPAGRSEAVLTPGARKITRDVWAPVRLAWAQRNSLRGRRFRPPWVGKVANAICDNKKDHWIPQLKTSMVPWRGKEGIAWPTDRVSIEEAIRKSRTRFFFERHKKWQDHYSAACVYSIAMNDRGGQRGDLAKHAIGELENALRGAETSLAAPKRSWLLAEDPDLKPLRVHEKGAEFANFEIFAYPTGEPTGTWMDDDPAKVEMTAYDREFISKVARIMERKWHERAAQGAADIHEAIQWFNLEEELWRSVYAISNNEARNWFDRNLLRHQVGSAAGQVEAAILASLVAVPECDEVLHGSWREHPQDFTPWPQQGKRPSGLVDDSLKAIKNSLDPAKTGNFLIDRCGEWERKARQVDRIGNKSFGLGTLKLLCICYAGIWERLQDVLENPSGEKNFKDAADGLPGPGGWSVLWRRIDLARHRIVDPWQANDA